MIANARDPPLRALRSVFPTALLSDSLREFGQYPGKGLKTQRAQVACWRSSHPLFVLQLLSDELEIRFVLAAVVQLDIELAAGVSPGFASAPHVGIGIRRGIVGEAA